jgi:hypothetical protein
MRQALFLPENHSVPVMKFPTRRDGTTEMMSGSGPLGRDRLGEAAGGASPEAQ